MSSVSARVTHGRENCGLTVEDEKKVIFAVKTAPDCSSRWSKWESVSSHIFPI